MELVQVESRGQDTDWDSQFQGLIKTRLVHGLGRSLLIPELLILGDERGAPALYFLPEGFFGSLIARTDGDYLATLFIDLVGGQTVRAEFSQSGWVRRMLDGSDLFKCNVAGSAATRSNASGVCRQSQDGSILLRVFHHTNSDSVSAITRSGELRGSTWNFAGTKRIKSNCYAYLTCVPAIRSDADLRRIAMSSSGVLVFWRDPFSPPTILPADWRIKFQGHFLELTVYRESTANRVGTLCFWAACDLFASPHLLLRTQGSNLSWYEVCSPSILRVPLKPGRALKVVRCASDSLLNADDGDLHRLNYAVVGDATKLTGLAAPYDEEDTSFIFKDQSIPEGQTCLEFWFEHANKPLYSSIDVSLQNFDRSV